MEIHSTAIVDESAVLGEGCTVGAYAIIEGGVHVGPDCTIASHAVLREGTHLGRGVRVDSFTVLGGEPQSVGFDSSIKSGVRVGDGVTFRESCTVHRSMFTGKETVIGNNCFFMAQAPVAHDCTPLHPKCGARSECSDIELPGLGTAQLPHPQRWPLALNVHTNTGSTDIHLRCILQLPELQVC